MNAAKSKDRRYQRVPLKPAKWVGVQGGGRKEAYRCTVMGLGGMFLECSDPLPQGTVLRMALEIGDHTIRGLAVVRNISPSGMGLAFLSLRPEDRGQIHRFLEGVVGKK